MSAMSLVISSGSSSVLRSGVEGLLQQRLEEKNSTCYCSEEAVQTCVTCELVFHSEYPTPLNF